MKAQYLAFFKPYEVLSQFTDKQNRLTLKDFIPIRGVYVAGRLDFRSEGLLFLTNDGIMIQRLTDPRFVHTKTYLVQVEGIIPHEAIQRLESEIVSPGLQTRLTKTSSIPAPDLPMRSKPVRDYHPTSWIQITLTEGKKHQVRRMTAAVGYPTLRLVRWSIGRLTVNGLQPGQWRQLDHTEITQMKMDLGIGP